MKSLKWKTPYRIVLIINLPLPSRIVLVILAGAFLAKLDVEDFQSEKMNPFDGTEAYAQTKRQQVIMTEQWTKMYKSTGIHFSSMHPGNKIGKHKYQYNFAILLVKVI